MSTLTTIHPRQALFGTEPHPAALPEIAINLFWHSRFNRDPAIMWMRQLIFDMFADA